MFFIKTLLSGLVGPLPVTLILLALGVALLWFTKRERAGKVLVSMALGVLTLFSLPLVGNALLRPLEAGQLSLYPAERLEAATTKAGRKPRWIVMLGAGHTSDGRMPPSDRLGTAGLGRLAEAIRLHQALPGTKLLFSGKYGGALSHAEVLAQAAIELGVAPGDIELDETT